MRAPFRSVTNDLRPSLLDDLGLVPALRWYADRQSHRGGFQSAEQQKGECRYQIALAYRLVIDGREEAAYSAWRFPRCL